MASNRRLIKVHILSLPKPKPLRYFLKKHKGNRVFGFTLLYTCYHQTDQKSRQTDMQTSWSLHPKKNIHSPCQETRRLTSLNVGQVNDFKENLFQYRLLLLMLLSLGKNVVKLEPSILFELSHSLSPLILNFPVKLQKQYCCNMLLLLRPPSRPAAPSIRQPGQKQHGWLITIGCNCSQYCHFMTSQYIPKK